MRRTSIAMIIVAVFILVVLVLGAWGLVHLPILD